MNINSHCCSQIKNRTAPFLLLLLNSLTDWNQSRWTIGVKTLWQSFRKPRKTLYLIHFCIFCRCFVGHLSKSAAPILEWTILIFCQVFLSVNTTRSVLYGGWGCTNIKKTGNTTMDLVHHPEPRLVRSSSTWFHAGMKADWSDDWCTACFNLKAYILKKKT